MRTVRAKEIRIGDEVWIGSGWSSHGTKDGYWHKVTEVAYITHWDTGTMVEVGATAFGQEDVVTIR